MITYNHSTLLYLIMKRSGDDLVEETSRVILENKVDLNGIDPMPLIQAAAKFNKPEFVDVYKRFRGDLSIVNASGMHCSVYASMNGFDGFLEKLNTHGFDLGKVKVGSGGTLIHACTMHGHSSTIETLARCNVSVHEACCLGLQAIHHANSQSVLNTLIECGANINAQDAMGNTVAHYAARDSRIDVFEEFTRLGGDLNLKNNIGQLPANFLSNEDALKISIIEKVKAAKMEINECLYQSINP